MILPLLGGEGRGEDERKKPNSAGLNFLISRVGERLASSCKTTILSA